MGRHAQRKLAGGGPRATQTNLLQIISVTVDLQNLAVTILWSGGVDAADYQGSDFATSPGNAEPGNIDQNGPNGLRLEFADDISNERFLRYVGVVAGTLTPQVVHL